jgi:hypothetical protein
LPSSKAQRPVRRNRVSTICIGELLASPRSGAQGTAEHDY